MNRVQAISVIENSFGLDGKLVDHPAGILLVKRVIEEMGFNALRDDAVIRLAEMQEEMERIRGQ